MAKQLDIGETIREFQEVLGEQFTLILSGMCVDSYESVKRSVDQGFSKMRKTIAAWQSGAEEPPEEVRRRYEIAHSAMDQLREAGESPQLIRAWFMASQPELGDEPPILFLAEGDPGSLDLAERRLNDCVNAYVSDSFG